MNRDMNDGLYSNLRPNTVNETLYRVMKNA